MVRNVKLAESAATVDEFTAFVCEFEPGLKRALCAAFGPELGREAASEALARGWERWGQVRVMENRMGYLFTIGRNWARRSKRGRRRVLHAVTDYEAPLVEPELFSALRALSERQRTVVMLVQCYQWSLLEVASVLDLKKTTVQNHLERGMASLRSRLGES